MIQRLAVRWIAGVTLFVALTGRGGAQPSNAAPASMPPDRSLAADVRTRVRNEEFPSFKNAMLDSGDLPAFEPGVNSPPEQPAPVEPALNVTNLFKVARQHRDSGRYPEATATYVSILGSSAAESHHREAMLELAEVAKESRNLPRAQEVYSQYVARWPNDPGIPEVLLRQGFLYRQMGLHKLAISKFYSVMTSSLVLKPEHLEYYRKLVRRSQSEIANTHFYAGNWVVAIDLLNRLLRSDTPPDDPSAIQHKIVLCSSALERKADVIAQAQDYLDKYKNGVERPEVRFLCAHALQDLGRSGEAFEQVLLLLKEQDMTNTRSPGSLAYWQSRAGNEIANRFYQEGDANKALEIYLALAALDNSAEWQMPVWYQAGLALERLGQPGQAASYYGRIVESSKGLGTNAGVNLKLVKEMAGWRKDFLTWQLKAETTNLAFRAVLMGTNKTDVLPN